MYSSSKLPLHVRVMLTTIKGSIIQFLGTLHVGIGNTLWQFSKQISKIFFQLSVQVHFFSWPNWKREEGLSWRVQKGGHIELFLKKSQTGEPMIHVNSTWVSLEHPWKFHFFFNWPREFPHALSSMPQEIPCPQYPLFVFFFWNSPIERLPPRALGCHKRWKSVSLFEIWNSPTLPLFFIRPPYK